MKNHNNPKIEDFQRITSPENERIRTLEKLNSKKYRDKLKQFSVENQTIIVDALKDGFDFESLFLTEDFADKHPDQIDFFIDHTESKNIFVISDRLNKRYSTLDTPSGITAVYNMKEKPLAEDCVIYLNGISDPGNLGAIMRSALAFDFPNLVLDKTTVDPYNPKVVSAARDAIFKLNIAEDQTGEWLKNRRLPLYATSSHLGTDLMEFAQAEKYCLVLGSESHGVDPEILKMAEATIRVSISAKIESLNVASAAAILFYGLKQKKNDQD